MADLGSINKRIAMPEPGRVVVPIEVIERHRRERDQRQKLTAGTIIASAVSEGPAA